MPAGPQMSADPPACRRTRPSRRPGSRLSGSGRVRPTRRWQWVTGIVVAIVTKVALLGPYAFDGGNGMFGKRLMMILCMVAPGSAWAGPSGLCSR